MGTGDPAPLVDEIDESYLPASDIVSSTEEMAVYPAEILTRGDACRILCDLVTPST